MNVDVGFALAVCIIVLVLTLMVLLRVHVLIVKAYLSQSLINLYTFARKSTLVQWYGSRLLKNHLPPHLPHVASVERVSDRTFRVLAQNPGYHTLQGTNTYLVTGLETDEHVLVDTGEATTAIKFLSVLFDEVFPLAKTRRLRSIVLTHGHHDHQGGVLPILAELQRRGMTPLPVVYKRKSNCKDTQPIGFVCEDIENNQLFPIDSRTHLRAVLTPGHTLDHISLVLEEDKAFLSGDCILGCGTAVFDDLHLYMHSLHTIKKIMERSCHTGKEIHTIYPGHGPVIRETALQKINEYIHHRHLREEQILLALHNSSQWVSSLDLLHVVYGPLPWNIVLSAQANLLHHLSKLLKEKKVEFLQPDLWKAMIKH